MPQMGGIQPPHNSYFTLTMIDDYRGLVFGGHQSKGRVDKLYLIDLSAMVSNSTFVYMLSSV